MLGDPGRAIVVHLRTAFGDRETLDCEHEAASPMIPPRIMIIRLIMREYYSIRVKGLLRSL